MHSRTALPLWTLLMIGVCTHSEAAPTIGTTNATPVLVSVGTPTAVTVTALITDPTLIPTSVNLLRINPTAPPTLIGQLRDDGTNGDQTANDKIFTGRTTINETAEGQVALQVNAAFKGTLTRAQSSVLTIFVTLQGLPPDPGPVGQTTLGGIDFDQDGIRDDVQRYIALTYSTSAKTRSALTQYAKAQQAFLLAGSNKQLATARAQDVDRAIACAAYSLPGSGSRLLMDLESHLLNTGQRASSYLAADLELSGQFFAVLPANQRKGQCTIDPDSLPN